MYSYNKGERRVIFKGSDSRLDLIRCDMWQMVSARVEKQKALLGLVSADPRYVWVSSAD